MGTNYYLHIGKRSSNGQGRPLMFTWALRPDLYKDAAIIDVGEEVTVKDEYGDEMSWSQFKELIRNDTIDLRAIGDRFS